MSDKPSIQTALISPSTEEVAVARSQIDQIPEGIPLKAVLLSVLAQVENNMGDKPAEGDSKEVLISKVLRAIYAFALAQTAPDQEEAALGEDAEANKKFAEWSVDLNEIVNLIEGSELEGVVIQVKPSNGSGADYSAYSRMKDPTEDSKRFLVLEAATVRSYQVCFRKEGEKTYLKFKVPGKAIDAFSRKNPVYLSYRITAGEKFSQVLETLSTLGVEDRKKIFNLLFVTMMALTIDRFPELTGPLERIDLKEKAPIIFTLKPGIQAIVLVQYMLNNSGEGLEEGDCLRI